MSISTQDLTEYDSEHGYGPEDTEGSAMAETSVYYGKDITVHDPGCQCHAVPCRTARGLIVDGVDLVPMPAPPPPATDPHEPKVRMELQAVHGEQRFVPVPVVHEPKEPRRAPTREEVRDLLRTFTSAVVEGESLYSNTPLPERRKQFDASREALLAAFDDLSRRIDALAAERDEWKRRAEAAQSEAVRVVQVHQHEWLMRASARETFENYVMRVMAASGADANFDDCFRNIIADYDRVLARADKAEAERDAARALVRDLRDSSPCDHFDHHGHCQTHGWMETDPPCPHGRATKLLAGEWSATVDPRIEAWRGLDGEQRDIVLDILRGAPQLKVYSETTRRALGDAAGALKAIGEK